jgi:hypothetical protein
VKPTVVVDLDGTLVDSIFMTFMLATGKKLPPTRWDCGHEDNGLRLGEVNRIIKLFADPDVQFRMPPMPGALDLVSNLSGAGFEIVALTARPESLRTMTEAYCKEYFPDIAQVDILPKGTDKSEFITGVLAKTYDIIAFIEDCPTHLYTAAKDRNIPAIFAPINECQPYTLRDWPAVGQYSASFIYNCTILAALDAPITTDGEEICTVGNRIEFMPLSDMFVSILDAYQFLRRTNDKSCSKR